MLRLYYVVNTDSAFIKIQIKYSGKKNDCYGVVFFFFKTITQLKGNCLRILWNWLAVGILMVVTSKAEFRSTPTITVYKRLRRQYSKKFSLRLNDMMAQ